MTAEQHLRALVEAACVAAVTAAGPCAICRETRGRHAPECPLRAAVEYVLEHKEEPAMPSQEQAAASLEARVEALESEIRALVAQVRELAVTVSLRPVPRITVRVWPSTDSNLLEGEPCDPV